MSKSIQKKNKMDRTIKTFSSESLRNYPFLIEIIKVANEGNSQKLIRIIEQCLFKVKLVTNLKSDLDSKTIEDEKLTEILTARMGDELKKKILEISNAGGTSSSEFLRQAAEYFIGELNKEISPLKK